MASADTPRQREPLPSISHFELDKIKLDRPDGSRYPPMNGLSISTAPMGSPSTIYSGPPPPYSYAPSTGGSTAGLSGYISPPESTTRRSTRDEKDSPSGRKSLPSIHEALGDKSLSTSFATPLSATASQQPGSNPGTAVGASFPEAPKGPSNPFAQPPTFRDNLFAPKSQPIPAPPPPPPPDFQQSKPPYSSGKTESRPSTLQSFGNPASPRSGPSSSFRPSLNASVDPTGSRSPVHPDHSRQSYQFSSTPSQAPAGYTSEPHHFSSGSRFHEQMPTYPRGSDVSYGDTVKRHLDCFDIELGLNEIAEASGRTMDFSRVWAQRHHQSNRAGYYSDSLPGLHEIDDMLRQSHRVLENLGRMREAVVAQQTALSEHRARMARGSHLEEDYNGISDDYKGGGFAGGDGKKRRGKAAPPGRCHSCNRAETPEWRRGPDGARTLCNACGLHYAKLTRKMGVSKAAALTGASLRPKSLDQRP